MNDEHHLGGANGLSRRQLLLRAGAAGLALSSAGLMGTLADRADGAIKAGLLGDTLTFSNWTLYIDIDEKTKRRPTLDQFTKRYGTKVKYIEDINDNATFFGKISQQLSRGKSTGRDLIVLTDNSPYPSLLIRKGWLEKLDKSVLPNLKNLQPTLRNPAWDPKQEYSLPWQTGMTGIITNTKLSKPVLSVDRLLTDPKLKGKVTLLTEMADSLGLVMLSNGDDPGKVDDASFDRAYKKLEAAKRSGQIRKFTGNDYSGPLAKGDLIACVGWSGDTVQLQSSNKNLRWAIPTDGGMRWTDHMLIPKGGDATTASTFMNFVYDPKIAAQIEAYVNYVCPVVGADKALAKVDPATAKNPLIFPTQTMLSKLHAIDPKALENRDYREKWNKLLGA
jgi:spermidine/putrescine transport system substrate-binding protein